MTREYRGWLGISLRGMGVWTMPKVFIVAVLMLVACFSYSSAFAEEVSQAEIRSLDEQVQEIKSDVLSIAAELNSLEERLLFRHLNLQVDSLPTIVPLRYHDVLPWFLVCTRMRG